MISRMTEKLIHPFINIIHKLKNSFDLILISNKCCLYHYHQIILERSSKYLDHLIYYKILKCGNFEENSLPAKLNLYQKRSLFCIY